MVKIKDKMNFYGILILICIFISFYFIATFFLDRMKPDKEVEGEIPTINEVDKNYNDEKDIVLQLYGKVKLLYDVVNSQFKVSQDDTIVINDITYKRITNFDSVMNSLFTSNGVSKYIKDLGNYFAYSNENYYLAGNLTNYQTYYFRGDNTNIYVLDANGFEINAIIYERWTSNNKNTLATIKIVKEENWLIDDIAILNNN